MAFVPCGHLESCDLDGAGGKVDDFTCSCTLVRPYAVCSLCRVTRWDLLHRPAKSREQRLNAFARRSDGNAAEQLSIKVIGSGRTAKRERRFIAFCSTLMEGSEPCCPTKEKHEQSSGKRIERPPMSNSRLSCNATYLRDDIVTRWSVRFIDEENPVDAGSAWTSACHN
jgi:hypothetical protein